MTTIVGISGSLRRGSFNTALLRAGAALMPAGSTLAVETLHGVPLYDGDTEEETGIPARVAELKSAVAGAAGLLLVTPEYNNSFPGVLKNAIDWMTRPPADIKKVFGGKPVALIGATPGGFGTTLAQTAWLQVLRTLGTAPWFGAKLLVSRAPTLFDAKGDLTDEATRESLRRFLAGFTAFAAAPRAT
ncbi:MAG TPA: NADPH-dependent FMN reductase [Planctomycetota bacterium]|nr:NADPH-dependent FMN reductase [Planctomycetota bacterium]